MHLSTDDEFEEISKICREKYKIKCNQYGVIPHRKILQMLGTTRLELRYMNIGPMAGLAVVDALKNNTITEHVDLSGNCLECRASCALMNSLSNNAFIVELNLTDNGLTCECAKMIGKYLGSNGCLMILNIGENHLADLEMHYIVEGMKSNSRLKELRISKSKIGSGGTNDLGELLTVNHSLKMLDISWNEIRGDSAYYFGLCLSKNNGLKCLNMSWNGLAEDGCLGLERCFSINTTLEEINITNNRITFECVYRLGRGLRKNSSLRILRIGLNNLTLAGVLDLMDAANSSYSALEFIDLEGQYIHSKVLYLIEKINKIRPFKLAYEKVLDLDDEIYNSKPKDPMEFLLEYLSDKAIRVVDFFRMIDKDGLGEVSRSLFIRNMKKMHVPMTNSEMQHVVSLIDDNKSGVISYSKLIQKLRGYQKVIREKELTKKINRDQKEERINIKAHLARLFEVGNFESPKFISSIPSSSKKRDLLLPPILKTVRINTGDPNTFMLPRERTFKEDKLTTLIKLYNN